MKRLLYILLCIFTSGFVIAFGGDKQSSPSTTEQDVALANYFYMEGTKHKAMENYLSAIDLLNEAIRLNPSLYAAKLELSEIWYIVIQKNKALDLLNEAANGDTTNYWYNYYYAVISSAEGDYETAESVVKRNMRNHPNKLELYQALINLYIAQNKYELAEQCIDSLETFKGNNATFNERVSLYEAMGDTVKILSFYEESIEKDPTNTYFFLYLSKEYHRFGYDSLAMQMLERCEQIDPSLPYIYYLKGSLYLNNNDTTAFMSEMEKLIFNPNINYDAKMETIIQFKLEFLNSDDDIDLVKTLYKNMTLAYPNDDNAIQIYISTLYYQENYQELATELETIINNRPDSCLYHNTLMYAYAQLENYERAIEVGYKALETGCEDVLQPLGIYLSYKKRYNEAQDILFRALNNTDSTQTELQANLYSAIANNYSSTDVEKAIGYYEKSIAITDTIISTLNNYAYLLAEYPDADLNKAEKMSSKTILKEPYNITYLDTYAWILFRKGSYSLAQIYIERAVSLMKDNDNESATIYEHYGDILYKLGKIEEAVLQWEKAYNADNENAILKRKIELKEYIEE